MGVNCYLLDLDVSSKNNAELSAEELMCIKKSA